MPTTEPNPLFLEVCTLIAQGDSVTNACTGVGVSRRTFFAALAQADDNSLLHASYTKARKARADSRSDEIDEIIRRALLSRADANYVEPNAARVAIDALRWQMGKENAKRYGDKLQVEDTTERKQLSREEVLAQLQGSGLRLPDVFASLTKRVGGESLAIEIPANSGDQSQPMEFRSS
jgi:hypothetical protein